MSECTEDVVGSVWHWSWDVTFAFLALHFKLSAGRITFWALWWDRANCGVHSGGRPCREVEACRTRRESEKKKQGTEAHIYNNHNCHVRHYLHSLTRPTGHPHRTRPFTPLTLAERLSFLHLLRPFKNAAYTMHTNRRTKNLKTVLGREHQRERDMATDEEEKEEGLPTCTSWFLTLRAHPFLTDISIKMPPSLLLR